LSCTIKEMMTFQSQQSILLWIITIFVHTCAFCMFLRRMWLWTSMWLN
jgi:hypothetical protein